MNKKSLMLAIRASILAGNAIDDVYESTDLKVEFKEDNSPLTIADKKAHEIILNSLKSTGIPILSEEGKQTTYQERKHRDSFWMVDPLDGTREFIKRNGEFTVNIALIEGSNPVFGIIYVPVTKDLYFGGKAYGSYKLSLNDYLYSEQTNWDDLLNNSIKLPSTSTENYTVVTSRSHLNEETQFYIQVLEKEHNNLRYIQKGSSLKMCAVAEGVANEYPRFGPCMEWDTAAGQAIVEGAGGEVLDLKDHALVYNKPDLLNPYFIVKGNR